MSEKITIHKGARIDAKTIPGKNGKPDWKKTIFEATDAKGNCLSPVEVMGDHTGLLRKYQDSGDILEVQSVVYNEQWNRYDCTLLKTSGGTWSGQKSGGGGSGTGSGQKSGGGGAYGGKYQGDIIPRDTYISGMNAVFKAFVTDMAATVKGTFGGDVGFQPEVAAAIVYAAGKAMNQYAIEVESNVADFGGFGRKTLSSAGRVALAPIEQPPGVGSPGANADTFPGESAAYTFIANCITQAGKPGNPITDDEAQELQMQVKANPDLTKEERSRLFTQIYKRSQNLV